MKTTWITGIFALAIAGLTACGPLAEGDPATEIVRGAATRIASVGDRDSAPVAPQAALTRGQIEARDSDLLRVSLISRDTTVLLTKAATNGNRVTWFTPAGIGLVFENGLLVGTRGLGDDLMGADIAGAKASLRNGGNHLRVLDFLNGLGQIERRTFQCTTLKTGSENITIFERTYATTILEETCTTDTGNFKNTYWRDANGVIWQSRQWISAQSGYLGYQRL